MLHFFIVLVLSWLAVGFVCMLGWVLAIFKLKFFTRELRYHAVSVIGIIVVASILGPLAYFYGAYCHALNRSD